MNKNILRLFFAGISFVVIIGCGCDEIQSPYKRITDGPDTNTTGKIIRKVFLEDYTGYRCGNCPKAADEAIRMAKLYDTNLIVLAVHSGITFAKPFGAKYKQDFRTDEGEQLFTDYIGNAGQPNGMVNRAVFDGQRVVGYTGWDAKYLGEKDKIPQAWIDVKAELNATTNDLNVSATVTALESLKANSTLALYLVEDSVYYWQLDYRIKPPADDNIEIYHRHVMRGSIGNTGAYGESLSVQAINKGQKITKTHSINLKDNNEFKFLPNAKHCSVIAIVSDPDTREVLQAQEVHVK